VLTLRWEVGHGNGRVRVLAGAELGNTLVDENRCSTKDQSRLALTSEIPEVHGN